MLTYRFNNIKRSLVKALGGTMLDKPKTPQQQIRHWITTDRRWRVFYDACLLVNCDVVEGAIVECGVGCGRGPLGHPKTPHHGHHSDRSSYQHPTRNAILYH